jgi:galactonate dehydratase
MKITGLKTFVANASRTNFVFVKLYTDEGIDGVGEATLEWKTLTVAHMAHARLIPVAPHNPVGPVMNAMTLHTAVAMPNFKIFETVSIDVPWRAELVRETLRFENGAILAPTVPGLGVELIEEACSRFPYAPYNVPLFDGTMNTSGVATGAATLTAKR